MNPPARLVAQYRGHNESTAANWEAFGPHRARVTSLAQQAGRGRLCVLGAGNCNDLDLPALAAHFGEILLVDMDNEALSRAVQRQPAEVQGRLRLLAPVDLSGALATMEGWATEPPDEGTLRALPDTAAHAIAAAVPSTADVVISTCVLSQIMWSVNELLGARHPHREHVAAALVVAHLGGLARLVRPGGVGLLITDTVSSPGFPLRELFDPNDPLGVMDRALAAGRVIPGTAPAFIEMLLQEDEAVAPLVEAPQLVRPWLWDLDARRVMLVYAMAFRRR